MHTDTALGPIAEENIPITGGLECGSLQTGPKTLNWQSVDEGEGAEVQYGDHGGHRDGDGHGWVADHDYTRTAMTATMTPMKAKRQWRSM